MPQRQGKFERRNGLVIVRSQGGIGAGGSSVFVSDVIEGIIKFGAEPEIRGLRESNLAVAIVNIAVSQKLQRLILVGVTILR